MRWGRDIAALVPGSAEMSIEKLDTEKSTPASEWTCLSPRGDKVNNGIVCRRDVPNSVSSLSPEFCGSPRRRDWQRGGIVNFGTRSGVTTISRSERCFNANGCASRLWMTKLSWLNFLLNCFSFPMFKKYLCSQRSFEKFSWGFCKWHFVLSVCASPLGISLTLSPPSLQQTLTSSSRWEI